MRSKLVAEPAKTPDLQLDFAEDLFVRPLAHIVQDAAGADLAVEDRGRPAQHLEALGAVGVDRHEGGEVGAFLPQAVAIKSLVGDVEAAQLEEHAARVGAVGLAGGAGGVAEHVAHLRDALRLELVGGDDGDRLRGLDQRRVGLGGGDAVLRDVAVDGAERVACLPLHDHGRELDGAA